MYFPGESAEGVLLRKIPKPNTLSPLLKFVQKLQIPRGNLIEWGCGGGWNLVPFRDAGWNVQGFDYDRPYVELGRTLLGLSLHEITAEEITLRSNPPNVILLNQVLEHAVEPVALLKRLRALCSEDTILVVGVPLLETIPIWHWRDFFHVAHIHYFSEESLVRVASLAGFRVVHHDTKKGMFALMKSEKADTLPIGRRLAMKSALCLAKGFIEPRYRARQMIRGILTAVGLIHVVRRAKRIVF
jgi:SAM-dependent methyltransferase